MVKSFFFFFSGTLVGHCGALLRLFHSPEFECQGNTSIGEGTLRTPINLEIPKECKALKHPARLAKNLNEFEYNA